MTDVPCLQMLSVTRMTPSKPLWRSLSGYPSATCVTPQLLVKHGYKLASPSPCFLIYTAAHLSQCFLPCCVVKQSHMKPVASAVSCSLLRCATDAGNAESGVGICFDQVQVLSVIAVLVNASTCRRTCSLTYPEQQTFITVSLMQMHLR